MTPHPSSDGDPGQGPVASLLVPLFGLKLLIPNAVVAEVKPFQPPAPVTGGPAWLLGEIQWQGHTTPLLTFEKADGKPEPDYNDQAALIILRCVEGGGQYALLAQQRPIPIRADRDNLRLMAPRQADHPLVECYVSIDGEHAAIPDLDALEALLDELR